MKPLRWGIGLSWLCSLSQEQITTITGQDITEKILEKCSENGAAPCTTENKTDHIRMVRGMATCWPHCPSPKLTQHHTKRFPLSLQFFQWKDSTQGRHPASPALWVTSWYSPLWSILQGLWGNLWGLTTMNLIVMEERGEASNNQNLNLCRPRSYLEHPSSGPKQWLCSSAKPSQWHSLTRELDRVQVCLILLLKGRAFPSWSLVFPDSGRVAES